MGLRRIDHPGRYMYRGVERSWFCILSCHRNIILAIGLFHLPFFVVLYIGPGRGP